MKPIDGDLQGYQAYKALLSIAFEHKLAFGLAIFGMVIFALSDAAFAYIMKPLMDDGFIEGNAETIKWIPFAIIGIFLVRVVAVFLRSYCMAYIGRNVINTLRTKMFDKLLDLTSDEYDQSSSATILTRFSYNVEGVAKAVSSSLTALIQDCLRIVVLLGYMLWLNWQLTAIFLTVGPIVFLIVAKLSGRFRKLSKNIQNSMGDVAQVAQEVVESNREVKIYGGIDLEREKFANANKKNLKLHLKLTATQSFSMPFIQLIVAIAFAAIIAFATAPQMRDVITTGDFVSFLFAMTMLLAPMRVLSSVNASIQKGIAAGESVFSFIALDSEKDSGSMQLDRSRGHLQFDRVSLCYRSSDARVLDSISFDVEPNSTVAIVGRSGSGKSSLVNLIPRLYEHEEGDILLDGVAIREYQLTDLRRQIAYVGQDVRLFNDTVRNNIAYGTTADASEEAVIEAAQQAYAWEYIKDLPNGLDTEIGERGVLLSGGQRQRLAIARALLKNAPILILDEATSALDTESERNIQHAIENLMLNRTTLVIAHRLSTVEHADKIIVMEQGKIVEMGTHEELLSNDSVYTRLHSMQFQDGDEANKALPSQMPPQAKQIRLKKSEVYNWVNLSGRRRQGWWLCSINPLSILLMPLTLLYGMVSRMRRLVYRIGIFRASRLPVKTIVVGNISLGGNGKTPVVVALYHLLRAQGYKPAIITRGYKSGAESQVHILYEGEHRPEVGDEANMMSELCACPIGVGANRVSVGKQLLERFPGTDLILSDDGLQHYALKRDLEVAVCRHLTFGNGLLIPAGPLRESRDRLASVDIIINRDSDQIIESLGEIWNLKDPERRAHITDFSNRQVHAVAGIGFPEVFFASLRQMHIDVIEHEFPDHYEFTLQDLDMKPTLPVLVTHKDAVKIRRFGLSNVWVVPLYLELGDDLQQQFIEKVEAINHG